MIVFSSNMANILFNCLILVLSIVMLWKGSGKLVESASKIAETFGISELVIGLTVVAFGTSAPEFAVTVNAAIKGQADISVANIVGSNIFNLGFILGTVALIQNINSTKRLVYRDCFFLILISFALLLVFHDHTISRTEGILFMSALGLYLIYLFMRRETIEEEKISHEKSGVIDFIILPVSLAMVVGGGHLLVGSSSILARSAGISEWIIGVTIVAAGTSAPELATSLTAALKGKHGMSAGNLIGSDIFNILGVLGLAGALKPLSITPHGYLSLIMLSAMVIMVAIFLRTGWQLTRKEGVCLLLMAIFRWTIDLIS